MAITIRAPIGPDDSLAFNDLARYIKPDARKFSYAHALLETEFVGPLDLLLDGVDPLTDLIDTILPENWENIVDLIPDDYMAVKSPFSGTLSKVNGQPGFVQIQMDPIKYTRQLSEIDIPLLNRLTHVYMGPIEFKDDFEQRLSAAYLQTVRVAEGEPIGTLQDRIFKLGFYGLKESQVVWIDPAAVIHYWLSAQHPFIANRGSPERLRVAGPYQPPEPVVPPGANGNYFVLEIRKHGVICEFHRPGIPIVGSLFSVHGEDELATRILDPSGEVVPVPAGASVRLSLSRVSTKYNTPKDKDDWAEGETTDTKRRNPASQDVHLGIGESFRPRDKFGSDVYEKDDHRLIMYVLFVAYKLVGTDDYTELKLFQDAKDRLREEYRDRGIPVPSRAYFSTPRALRSPYFDARELHLQHDYNYARASYYNDERKRQHSDLTILEDEIRGVADFIHTRYLYHLFYSDAPLIADPEKKIRIRTDLNITRGFFNPRRNGAFGYSRLHPRQYGHFLEFRPAYKNGLKMKALRMACTDFLRAIRTASGVGAFKHLFFQFTRRVGQSQPAFWKIELDAAGNESASTSIRLRDDGSVQTRSVRRIGGVSINSTQRAEQHTDRIALTWQPHDLLTRPIIPVADANPVATASEEPVKKTSVILLATEAAAIPPQLQFPLDDKARTLADWLKQRYPEDHEPRIVQTVTLGDAFAALGLMDGDEEQDEQLRIRYLAIVSHSRFDLLYLRNFEEPPAYNGSELDLDTEHDIVYKTRYRAQLADLRRLYPHRVKVRREDRDTEIFSWLLEYTSLAKLSHRSKQRLRETFSEAEAILLTGCAAGFAKYTHAHRLGPVAAALARVADTDVYASDEKVHSYAMKADGNWKYHRYNVNKDTGVVTGPYRNDGASSYPGLRVPLTVVSVRESFAEIFEQVNGIYKADPNAFDVIKHYATHLQNFYAPSKRRRVTLREDDDAGEDLDDGTVDFDDGVVGDGAP
jgi:hypothetical protein